MVSPMGWSASLKSPNAEAKRAGVAQLVELLICNQPVAGSSPVTSFLIEVDLSGFLLWRILRLNLCGFMSKREKDLSIPQGKVLYPKSRVDSPTLPK